MSQDNIVRLTATADATNTSPAFQDFVQLLESFRTNPSVVSSSWAYLEELYTENGEDSDELIAALLCQPARPQEFRVRMLDIALNLGVNVSQNQLFNLSGHCSEWAVWTMPVVLAELLANRNGHRWAMADQRPKRQSVPNHRPVTLTIDKSTGEYLGMRVAA